MYEDYKITPINDENVLQVLEWRNLEIVRNNMFDNSVIPLENHINWYNLLKVSKDRVGFVFEYKGQPVGVFNAHEREASPKKWIWSCYLGKPGIIPKIGTKLGLFAMEHLFEKQNCEVVIGEMVKANTVSHKFNLAIGFHVEKDIQVARPNGVLVESVLLVQTKSEWLKNKKDLFNKAFN